MNGFALLLATSLLGVDYGWQPANDGRLEYIIQLEPVTLIALREGQEIVSQIDPFVRGVRRFRIRVGTDVVPRVGSPPQQPDGASPAAAAAPPPGVVYGWQATNAQHLDFIVQIAPERLAILPKEPILGEIPAELRSITRVRIRSGTGELPRQNISQTSPPVTSVPQGNAQPSAEPRSSEPTAPTTGAPAGIPAANGQAAGSGIGHPAASVNNSPPHGQPDNRGGGAGQPSRYDPPASTLAPVPSADARATNPPITDQQPTWAGPAGGSPSAAGHPQTAQGDLPATTDARSGVVPQHAPWANAAAQDSSWSAGQPAPAGDPAAPATPTGPSNWGTPAQPGTAAPGGQSGWVTQPTPSGQGTGFPSSMGTSPTWGTNDGRGQWAGNASPAPASEWPPMESLPPPVNQPLPSPSPQSSAWPSSSGGAPSPGAMNFPSLESRTPTGQTSSSLASLTHPPWQTAAAAWNEAGFPETTRPKKVPDFWADLAAAANDPALGFLREEGRLEEHDKPWWPLTLAVLALFASMGGNLYMGWIAVDVYRRYLEIAEDDDVDDEPYDSPRERDDRRDWEGRTRRRERASVLD